MEADGQIYSLSDSEWKFLLDHKKVIQDALKPEVGLLNMGERTFRNCLNTRQIKGAATFAALKALLDLPPAVFHSQSTLINALIDYLKPNVADDSSFAQDVFVSLAQEFQLRSRRGLHSVYSVRPESEKRRLEAKIVDSFQDLKKGSEILILGRSHREMLADPGWLKNSLLSALSRGINLKVVISDPFTENPETIFSNDSLPKDAAHQACLVLINFINWLDQNALSFGKQVQVYLLDQFPMPYEVLVNSNALFIEQQSPFMQPGSTDILCYLPTQRQEGGYSSIRADVELFIGRATLLQKRSLEAMLSIWSQDAGTANLAVACRSAQQAINRIWPEGIIPSGA